jgi:hypothetical protein
MDERWTPARARASLVVVVNAVEAIVKCYARDIYPMQVDDPKLSK